ncbi:hypothetical protein UA08_06028 [Talaromyces atroroseus]|uniref:Uncharacterized protein n=1 Tax=Talaromyces atroroseus TaxID=1441469 RepID=A0A225AYU7_TALAT|nr:hypothetical protein UA08_06028 [Talaromyces atroroseus]OKL58677.1 hypothetical protein UA08_06028 [Talaromyces atroroseus]
MYALHENVVFLLGYVCSCMLRACANADKLRRRMQRTSMAGLNFYTPHIPGFLGWHSSRNPYEAGKIGTLASSSNMVSQAIESEYGLRRFREYRGPFDLALA